MVGSNKKRNKLQHTKLHSTSHLSWSKKLDPFSSRPGLVKSRNLDFKKYDLTVQRPRSLAYKPRKNMRKSLHLKKSNSIFTCYVSVISIVFALLVLLFSPSVSARHYQAGESDLPSERFISDPNENYLFYMTKRSYNPFASWLNFYQEADRVSDSASVAAANKNRNIKPNFIKKSPEKIDADVSTSNGKDNLASDKPIKFENEAEYNPESQKRSGGQNEQDLNLLIDLLDTCSLLYTRQDQICDLGVWGDFKVSGHDIGELSILNILNIDFMVLWSFTPSIRLTYSKYSKFEPIRISIKSVVEPGVIKINLFVFFYCTMFYKIR